MYDVAIIGLGPAGSTLARLLDKSLSVIAIDKKNLSSSDGFRKPCGGLLSIDAQRALSKFNLTLPKSILVDPQIFAVKTIDTKQKLVRHYQRFYINMDRHKFDQWLMRLIPRNIEMAEDAFCKNILKTKNRFEITYEQGTQEIKVHAKYVVGADGSDSFVRKKLFENKKIERYLSIQQHFVDQRVKPFYSCIFDSDITDSYCWSISKDGHFVLGGAFPINGGKQLFEQLKNKVEELWFPLGDPLLTEACLVSHPKKISDFCAAGSGTFLVGEAAGFISPSSLEGISYALNTAHILAKVLNSQCKNPCRTYRIKIVPIRAKLLMKILKSQFMYRPFLRKLVMKSGLLSIEVVKEDQF
ncbi:oxidoreductase [Clostridia bacterium]|nr:oxidoreductase [Clostridia bacterium]